MGLFGSKVDAEDSLYFAAVSDNGEELGPMKPTTPRCSTKFQNRF